MAPRSRPVPQAWLDPAPAGESIAFDDFPAALLMRAALAAQARHTAVYVREHGLTVPEWRILSRLHESAPMQLGELCRIGGIDKAHAGRILRGLAKSGLAATRADASHGRRQIVDITPEGRRLARRIMPIARRHQSRLLELLSLQERRALFSALDKILHDGEEPA